MKSSAERQSLATVLHPGATEHYQNAEAYEHRYRGRSEDIAYYLRKCAASETILEYGAGAGRLTIPLAERGVKVFAVDSSAAMLELLRARLGASAPEVRRRVSVQHGDMRTFRTRRHFDAVIAGFHTACHLYTRSDMEAFLARALAHLRPGGRLEFDLPLPRIDTPGYDPLSQVCVMEMDSPTGSELLTLRWYFPQEITMYLHHAGFTAVRLRSDFTSQRIDSETGVFTVSAKKPG